MDGPYTEDTRLREEGVRPCSNHQPCVPKDALVANGNLQGEFASRENHVTVTEEKLSQISVQPQKRPRNGATFTRKVHHFLVFLACCLATFTSMGTAFGMGSVYLDIVESYQTTRPLAAIVLSLASGMGFGAGIITGPVIGHVGGATTMVAGSLLCCVGCIGSSLAPNIYVVIVCFGAITGFGVSCCFLSASVIAGTSFKENSKVVLPVVSMSGGVGMTVFPYMLRWLVDEFTLKGMFLVLAGVSLNSVLFGVVLKVFDESRDPAPGEDELEIHVEAVPVQEMRKGRESWNETSLNAKGENALVKSESKKSICELEIHVEAMPVQEMRKGIESWSETSVNAKGENTLVKSESKKSICNEEKNDTMKLESTESIANERTETVLKPDRGDGISDRHDDTVKKSVCGDINGKARNSISNGSIPDTANMMGIEPYELETVSSESKCQKPTKETSVPDENTETSDVGNIFDFSSNITIVLPGEGNISKEHFHDDKNETRKQAQNGSAKHTRQNETFTDGGNKQEKNEVSYNEHGRNKNMMLKTLSGRGHSNVSFEDDVDDMETALHVDEWNGHQEPRGMIKESSENSHQEPRGMIKESSAVSLSKKVQISSPSDDTQNNNTETDVSPQRRPSTAGGRRRSSVYEALQVGLVHNTRYVLVTIATYSRFLSFNLPGIFLTDISRERGLSVEQGTHLLVILYCSNVAGRGLIGLILYIRHFSSLGLLGVTTLIAGLAAYGFTLLDYYDVDNVFAGYAVVCALHGLFYGGCITCGALSCLELVNLHQFAQALGYQYFIGGFSSTVGGPVGGWLKDYTGSYNSVFYMIVIQGCIAAVACFVGMCFGPKSSAKRESRNTTAALGKHAIGKVDLEVNVETITETYGNEDEVGKAGLGADVVKGKENDGNVHFRLENVCTRL